MTKSELQDMINEMVEENIYKQNKDYYNKIIEECSDEVYRFESNKEYLYEGANTESTEAFNHALKQIKEYTKRYHKCLKTGDKEGAKDACKEAKKALDDAEKDIRKTSSDIESAVFGFFASELLTVAHVIYVGMVFGGLQTIGDKLSEKSHNPLPEFVAEYGGAAYIIIKHIIYIIKDIKQFIDEFKNDKNNTYDKFNLYKNKLLRFINDLKKVLDTMEKKIK